MRKTPKTDLDARHWAKAFEAANLVTNYSHVSEQHYPKYSFSNPALFMFWTAGLDTQIVHLEEHISHYCTLSKPPSATLAPSYSRLSSQTFVSFLHDSIPFLFL